MGDAMESARGLVLRLISPTVIAGAGIAVAATGVTAEYVDAAGVSHPVEVRPPDGEQSDGEPFGDDRGDDDDDGDGGGDGGAAQSFGSESVTVLDQTATGHSVTSSLETTISPGGTDTGDGPAPNVFQSEQGGVPENLGDDILVEFDQHIVVHELPNGQFSVESIITITVHRDGHSEVFEERDSQVVTKEHADTDLVIRQDGQVTIRIDDDGNVTADVDGDLSVHEQPGNPHDSIPEGAIVIVQDQELNVIDEDDGDADDVDDPDVFGHFEQTADAQDDPGDGEVDVFVVDQNQVKHESEVDTSQYGTRGPTQPQTAPSTPAAVTSELMVHTTAQTYVAPPPGLDPAFATTTNPLPDATGLLDTPMTPVARDSLGPQPDPADAAPQELTGTDGHFDPPVEDPLDDLDDVDPASTLPGTGQPEDPFTDGLSDVDDGSPLVFDTDPTDGTDAFDPSHPPDGQEHVDPTPSHLDAAQL